MPATQNVTLEPALHCVLAEHLHHSTIRCKLSTVCIFREVLAQPNLLTNFVDGLQLVGLCLVWPKDPEIVHVSPRHLPKKIAQFRDTTGPGQPGFFHFDTGAAKIRHIEWLAQQATIRDRISAHPSITLGS